MQNGFAVTVKLICAFVFAYAICCFLMRWLICTVRSDQMLTNLHIQVLSCEQIEGMKNTLKFDQGVYLIGEMTELHKVLKSLYM